MGVMAKTNIINFLGIFLVWVKNLYGLFGFGFWKKLPFSSLLFSFCFFLCFTFG